MLCLHKPFLFFFRDNYDKEVAAAKERERLTKKNKPVPAGRANRKPEQALYIPAHRRKGTSL